MRKLKLVIADDETSIRNAISNMIDWESNDIEICGIVKNGKEALDIIMSENADIALLDIRMPIMTGLEVIANLKILESNAKAVILSGYDDFSYAREALKWGAANYLLKPCRPDEILEAILEVKKKILEEYAEKLQEKERIQELEISRYDVKNKRLADLILTTNEMMVSTCEEKIGYKIGDGDLCLVIKPSENSIFFLNQQRDIIGYLEENLPCVGGCIAENIVAVLKTNHRSNKKLLRELLIKLKQSVERKYAVVISIGVGDKVNRVDGLRPSYQNALKALGMIHFLGSEFVIFYDSIYRTHNNIYPTKTENEIIEAIKNQNTEECNQKVDEFFDASREENGGNGMIKNAIAILLSLYHYTVISGFQADDIFVRPLDLMDYIQKSLSIEELTEKIKCQCTWIMKQMDGYLSENRFVNAAILYLRQNYHRDITLSMVAEEMFITPGYLSTLFNQTMGDSFTNYLNRIRIEKATHLLKDLQLKTYEVAYQVGFSDEKYFTKVFKKINGVSPSQYRKEK